MPAAYLPARPANMGRPKPFDKFIPLLAATVGAFVTGFFTLGAKFMGPANPSELQLPFIGQPGKIPSDPADKPPIGGPHQQNNKDSSSSAEKKGTPEKQAEEAVSDNLLNSKCFLIRSFKRLSVIEADDIQKQRKEKMLKGYISYANDIFYSEIISTKAIRVVDRKNTQAIEDEIHETDELNAAHRSPAIAQEMFKLALQNRARWILTPVISFDEEIIERPLLKRSDLSSGTAIIIVHITDVATRTYVDSIKVQKSSAPGYILSEKNPVSLTVAKELIDAAINEAASDRRIKALTIKTR